MPAVSNLDVWRKKLGRWQQGHDLWRSLNAAIILTSQMRQAQRSTIRSLQTILSIAAVYDVELTVIWISAYENAIADAVTASTGSGNLTSVHTLMSSPLYKSDQHSGLRQKLLPPFAR